MARDPQQELFSKLKVEIKKLGYKVYDGKLPPEGTPYPFVYMADSEQTDDMSMKNAVLANVQQTIHVWHSNVRQRGKVSDMLFEIKKIAFKLTQTESYKWALFSVDQRILDDDTTSEPLLHGYLMFNFKLTGF